MPRKVNPIINEADLEVLYLGSSGRSSKYIMTKTGYTTHQITYRLKKESIKRIDYRDGNSQFSQRMERMGRHVFLVTILRKLRRKYK